MWMEQVCAYVFDPASFTEENTNVRGRGGKDSVTYPHPRCSSLWQVAGMQSYSSLLGLQDLQALARRREGRLPRSSEASYGSAKHWCVRVPVFSRLVSLPCYRDHCRTRVRNSSCELFSAHQLQPPITASEAEARDLLILSERMSPEGGKAASTRSRLSQEKVIRCGVEARSSVSQKDSFIKAVFSILQGQDAHKY